MAGTAKTAARRMAAAVGIQRFIGLCFSRPKEVTSNAYSTSCRGPDDCGCGTRRYSAFAQAAAPSRRPDVIDVPTPEAVVEAMLQVANVTKNDVVYDLGCGDGRFR